MSVPQAAGARDWRIDFWRGSAILMIFVNHLDVNALSALTTRTWGFSDAAELFVFIGGLMTARVLEGRLRRGRAVVARYVASRAVRLYAGHLLLFFALAAVCAAYKRMAGADDFIAILHYADFFAAPTASLRHAATLTYLPAFADVLPLYILLTLFAGALFIVLGKNWQMMLALSFGLYAAAHLFGLNLPADAGGRTWFFNPFCWQLLFVTGAAVWLQRHDPDFIAALNSPVLLGLSSLMVGFGIFSTTPWALGLMPPSRTTDALAPFLDKHNLSLFRYAHFLAVAHIVYVLTRDTRILRQNAATRAVARVGACALPAFVFATVLSTVARAYAHAAGAHPGQDTVIAAVGVAAISAFAAAAVSMREARRAPQRNRPLEGR